MWCLPEPWSASMHRVRRVNLLRLRLCRVLGADLGRRYRRQRPGPEHDGGVVAAGRPRGTAAGRPRGTAAGRPRGTVAGRPRGTAAGRLYGTVAGRQRVIVGRLWRGFEPRLALPGPPAARPSTVR